MGLKIAGTSILVLLVLCGGFYWYFTWSQDQLAEHQKTIARQETAILSLETAVINIKENIATQSKNLKSLDTEQSNIKSETDKLSKILAKHDLELLANRKPVLIERRANAATAKILNELAELTKKETQNEN